ncbi:SH3 domain-containing protein [Aeribacillus alveayuensis]|uniref:Mannosyl-glycoprotein endo-beta-N-acetylglucosaminidase n=1 Tax=Aeribacillus alveayuensis TaxID=279215 RepID=A0ABT9VLQ3_9BACI|nr:mannosyl-glycoprotein endo-beta-N-acetylglucosaminidase [Bacillus alveayuensis]
MYLIRLSKIFTFVTCFSLLLSLILTNFVFAESTETDDSIQKVLLLEELSVENEDYSLTFNENSIFYVREVENHIFLRIGDNEIEIENPEKLQLLETIYLSDLEKENEKEIGIVTHLKETNLYADESLLEEQGKLLRFKNLPVFAEGDNFLKVKVGYQFFYIPKKDVNYVKNEEVNENSDLNETDKENENNNTENTENINELNQKHQAPFENETTYEQQPDNETVTNQDNGDVDKIIQAEDTQKVEQNNKEDLESNSYNEMTTSQSGTFTVQSISVQFGEYFKVKNSNVSVYDNSSGKLIKVGELVKNQIYPIVSVVGNWHKIKFGNGYGYVWKEATEPADIYNISNLNKGERNSGRIIITLSTLTVYDNSSGQLVPFGTIEKGREYPIIGVAGNWYKIDYAGRIGYVYAPAARLTFASGDRYFKVVENNVSVYDNSSGQLVKVGSLTKGQVYPIVSVVGNWHKIKFGNGYGYVWKEATEPANIYNISNLNKGERNNGRTIITLSTLTVYDNSSGQLVPFGTIEKGREYPIIGVAGNWYKIDYAGRIGYVYAPAARLTFASGDRYFKVVENNVSVYDNSSGQLVKVGSLTKGQVYPIVSIVGNWHRIKFGNGYGYVWKNATEPDNGNGLKNLNDGLKNTKKTFTAMANLSVYDNTSGKLVSFGMIDKGVNYPIIGEAGNWFIIDFSGRIGYVTKMFAETKKYVSSFYLPVYRSLDELEEYKLHSTIYNKDYTRYAELYYGDTLEILEESKYAAKVKLNDGKIGWVQRDYIEDSITEDWWLVKDGRNLRSSYTTNSSVIGFIPKNSKVKVLDYKYDENQAYKSWAYIETENGQRGWIWAALSTAIHNEPPYRETGYNLIKYEFNKENTVVNEITLFTPLNTAANVTASDLNNYIAMKTNGKDSLLVNTGEYFLKAYTLTGLNPIYLLSHAIHETGWGTSGIVNSKYNFYGINVTDTNPNDGYDYSSIEGGIVEGANWIMKNYIKREEYTNSSYNYSQPTLDSMRNDNSWHEYATDESWAVKIVEHAKGIFEYLKSLGK